MNQHLKILGILVLCFTACMSVNEKENNNKPTNTDKKEMVMENNSNKIIDTWVGFTLKNLEKVKAEGATVVPNVSYEKIEKPKSGKTCRCSFNVLLF